jgi:murein DD-endopeptidase MepM/ murein hydrolase activator NlpD
MNGTLSRLGARLFPDRQVLIRSNGQVTHLNLSSALQMSVVAASLVSVAAISLSAVSSNSSKPDLDLNLQVDGGASQADLARAVETLKQQLADAKAAAQQADSRVKTLADQGQDAAASPDGQAQQTAAELDAAKLAERVAQLENDIKVLGVQNDQNRSLYEHTAEQLAQATNERQKLTAEKGKLQKSMGELAQAKDAAEKTIAADRERLKLKVSELEKKLASKLTPRAEVSGKLVTVAPTTEGEEEEPAGKIETADNGFSIAKLLAELGVHQASIGGPYVAVGANKGAQLPDEQVAKLMKTLPLTAPLDKYNFESPFGVRHDPFNGRAAMHTGVDLSGPYKTPVMSTAPGTVVFAGYSAGYGKLVEIDHGNGIHTKYGHLNRILVNVGQKVGKHNPIGLLGSSGRSTGPHVHYEVVVNGTPQDPEKFLEAGKSGVLKVSN